MNFDLSPRAREVAHGSLCEGAGEGVRGVAWDILSKEGGAQAAGPLLRCVSSANDALLRGAALRCLRDTSQARQCFGG